MTPLEHLEQAFEQKQDRLESYAETGFGGLLRAGVISLLQLEPRTERKRATPVVTLLEHPSQEWSWLDTLRTSSAGMLDKYHDR